MPVRSSSSQDLPYLSSPALVAKLSRCKTLKGTVKLYRGSLSEEDLEECSHKNVFEEYNEGDSRMASAQKNIWRSHEEEDPFRLPEKKNDPSFSWPKTYEDNIEEIFMKYFEPCIEEMCSIRDDCLNEEYKLGNKREMGQDEDYLRSESSDSAVEILTEEEEMFHDPGRYFTDMINEVFGCNATSSASSNMRSRNSVQPLYPSSKESDFTVSSPNRSLDGPLIPLYSSPPLQIPLSPSQGEVKSKISRFESLLQSNSSSQTFSSSSGKGNLPLRTQLWFHKDGLRSSSELSKEETSDSVALESDNSISMVDKPPMHPKSPRMRRKKTPEKSDSSVETSKEQSLTESNRILRNSLGKMEPSERIKLEEILDMCVEYERQIESQIENKGGGNSSGNDSFPPHPLPALGRIPSIPLHSPNGTAAQPKGIKTNGSLPPRDKRHTSPSKESENSFFNFEGISKGSDENGSLLMPPSSPRTRIRTYLGGNNPTSPHPYEPFDTEEASPISRKPPRSKHDPGNGPASPLKDADEPTLSPSLPSEEAPSRLLIGMTMLNHRHSSNHYHRNSNTSTSNGGNRSSSPVNELDNTSRLMVETLKSQRHTQILILSTVKRQLSDLESEASEGLKELELERSLILAEREAEASELEKLKLRCSQLKTQEARLSGVFQELQKSLSRKTDNAKMKIEEAKEEIARLEGDLRGSLDKEAESVLYLRLKEQHEILDTESKAYEDLEFHQMEEETSKETEREELLKEISDMEALVKEKGRRLEDIDSHRKKVLINARNETQSLLAQRQKLLCDLDRERIKLCSIERKLSSFFLSPEGGEEEEEEDGLISTSSSIEEEENQQIHHLHLWNKNSELDHALKRLDLLGEDPACIMQSSIHSQKTSEHSTTLDDDSEDEGIRISVTSSSYIEANDHRGGRKTSREKMANYKNMIEEGEYHLLTSASSSESTKSSSLLSTNKNVSAERRPVSEESSSYWEENVPSSSIQVKRRGGANRGQQTQRPLTRYLPIRNEGFDLRVHIESAGHPIDSNPAVSRHIHLNSSSCRGHLYKMSSKFRKWNRRWFVFDRNKRTLIYYSDKTETKAKGGIYFESIEDVYVDHLNTLKSPRQKEAFLMKTRERLYCLMAPSVEAMRIWIDVIFTGAEGFQGCYNNTSAAKQ